MKRVLLIVVLAGSLTQGLKAEDSGFILGVSAGGSVALNALGSDGLMASTALLAGLKVGYQGLFVEPFGVRFYLSALASYGVYPSARAAIAGQDIPLAQDLYIMGDVNADFLFNWANESDYTSGLFGGIFTGALVGLPLKNSTGKNSVGTTLGLNVGVRATIAEHHQFEVGVKCGMAFFTGQASSTSVGALIGLQTGYVYKF